MLRNQNMRSMGIIMVYKRFEKARGHDETCITDDCLKTKQQQKNPPTKDRS